MQSRCSDGLTAGTGLDEGCLYKINPKDWLIAFHLLECLTTKSIYYFLYNIPQPLSRGKTRFYRNYELAVYLFGGILCLSIILLTQSDTQISFLSRAGQCKL